MLPLETTPTQDETRQLSLIVGLGFGDLRKSIWEYMALGQDLQVWDDDSPLRFRDMEEVGVVESRLKEAVSSWMEGEDGLEAEYEFTLKSRAKGKSRV